MAPSRFNDPVEPMTLGNMSANGVRSLAVAIGIAADYRLHVSERLLGKNDGLEALKRLNGGSIHLPGCTKDRPDRDRLAPRFERFKMVA
jgi:putative restriction endonuclease